MLWNAVSQHFEGSNHCSNPTAVRCVTVFNLRYIKNVKLKHFRGPFQLEAPEQVAPPAPSPLRGPVKGYQRSRTVQLTWHFSSAILRCLPNYLTHFYQRFLLIFHWWCHHACIYRPRLVFFYLVWRWKIRNITELPSLVLFFPNLVFQDVTVRSMLRFILSQFLFHGFCLDTVLGLLWINLRQERCIVFMTIL